ncbi:hypothetical protein L6270_01370 [Candidatus Parcubacteria bacterium]|nr:hypothetical protein [Patescibacteria group bacterium]MBU4309790.1 hypothetical protein [Patescibacteria group bacterium]MBU4578129.1 hypothetical protein [Patescibacteria group bacterium]MCG2696666.1 hypothetical protein [Candidatus Parcubacteria bacterium]
MDEIKIEDFIIIETHFGVSEHFIKADTRNKCSEDLVVMIREMSEILFPDDVFNIYLLPPEPGSYKDIVKFVKKNKIGVSVGTVMTIGGLVLGYLNYRDVHETHIHDSRLWVIDDTVKCLELQKQLEDLNNNYEVENIPQEKILEVCGNIILKKRKNNFYNTLNRDGMIKNNETILKNAQSEQVFSKMIERNDFVKYIEPILDAKYFRENIEGVVELISPVVRQKKEGKGIPWRGTYYGDNIFYNEISVLRDGDDIEFYMQDSDFKDQISNKERAFAVKDNMRIVFDISGELKGNVFQNRGIYIKEVKSYNKDQIVHKIKPAKKQETACDNQQALF